MAIAGNALPFFLISWGQQTIDSGVAGMIMAIMPLMTMVFAHYLVEGETLNRYKIIGFCLGISGVTLLLGPVFEGGTQALLSGLAIFTAATCYAVNAILIKRLPRFSPMVGACGVLIMASLVMLPFWLLLAPVNNSISDDSMLAVIWLGIGPTGIATIVLFAVIDSRRADLPVDDQLPGAGGGFLLRRLATVGTGELASFRRTRHDSERHRHYALSGDDSATAR